jgi:tetratricopeptide (TPR) repeat protein
MNMSILNYPPEEIINPPPLEKKNFEHIILWMLHNNDECEWSHFTDEPLNISISTLSNYLSLLKEQGYVEQPERSRYVITSRGEERYNELSRAKKASKKLSYPPSAILTENLKDRNYEHILLWMVYNNNRCKWSDFLEEPLSINQSSLSKNLNSLIGKGFVIKENKKYKITQEGKQEYSKMLKYYDLDRQSILEEESKRIEEITKKTRSFFMKYNVKDEDIKFRFLNNVLKMDYARVRNSLEDEEDFKKILLFFAINHPNSYPEYISPADFSVKYGIEKIILEFHILQIVEKEIYPIKFFSFDLGNKKKYYFQDGEKIEKVLRAIVDEYITKFTYLNKLGGYPFYTMYSLIDDILVDICESCFSKELREPLRDFLPNYIKYLTYKIETEKQLIAASDKLEGFIYENVPAMMQNYDIGDREHYFKSKNDPHFYLYPDILKVLAPTYMKEILAVFKETLKYVNGKEVDQALNTIDSAIKINPDKIELFILKAIILCLWTRPREVMEILEGIHNKIEDKDKDRLIPTVDFVLCFSYLSIGEFKKALKLSEKSLKKYPNQIVSNLCKAMVIGYNTIYKWDMKNSSLEVTLEEIEKIISLETNRLNSSRIYQFKAIVLFEMKRFDDGIIAIDKAIELTPNIIDCYYKKIHGFLINLKFPEMITFLDEMMQKFPQEKKHLLQKKSYAYLKWGYYDNDASKYEEGDDILKELINIYPNEYDFLNSRVYSLAYLEHEEESVNLAKELTKLVPNEGNYHDSYGEVLMIFKRHKEAIEEFKKAIELDRYGWFVYQTFIKMGICYYYLEDYALAKENIEIGIESTKSCMCDLETKEYWAKRANKYLIKIKTLLLEAY